LLAKRNKDNIETLFSSVGLLVNTPFGQLLNTHQPEIDLMDVYRNRKIVYFALDTQELSANGYALGQNDHAGYQHPKRACRIGIHA